METLRSTSDVIDALGGTAAVAALTGRTMQAVSNWRVRGLFTASTYLVITDALAGKGKRAEAALWRSVPPSAVRAAAGEEVAA